MMYLFQGITCSEEFKRMRRAVDPEALMNIVSFSVDLPGDGRNAWLIAEGFLGIRNNKVDKLPSFNPFSDYCFLFPSVCTCNSSSYIWQKSRPTPFLSTSAELIFFLVSLTSLALSLYLEEWVSGMPPFHQLQITVTYVSSFELPE